MSTILHLAHVLAAHRHS